MTLTTPMFGVRRNQTLYSPHWQSSARIGADVPDEPANPDPTSMGTYPSSITVADANLLTSDEPAETTVPEGARLAGDII
jgi:hypothetical protein